MPLSVSQSELKSFRRCKRQYFYKVIEGLEARLTDPKLKFGSWVHDLLRAHYMGEDWRKQHDRQLKQFQNLFIEEREFYGDMPQLAERMMESYLWKYRKEESEWETLYVEETFEIHFAQGDTFSFTPDLIVRDHSDNGSVWVVDHKTVRSIPSGEWRLEDLQSTLYPWALSEGMDLDVKGFIFNYIRRKAPTVPHINQDGSISRARIDTDYPTLAKFLIEFYEVDSVNELPVKWKKQLANLKLSTSFFKRSRIIKPTALINRQIEEFSYSAQELESWLELWQEQKAKDDGIDPWVRTLVPSCEWDCDFHDLCMIELLGQDSKFMRRSKYQASKYQKGRRRGKG